MNQDRFAGIWKQFGGKMKEHWGKLTNNPLVVTAGTCDQFAGRIQERYGISKEEATRQLMDFLDRNRNWNLSNRKTALSQGSRRQAGLPSQRHSQDRKQGVLVLVQ